MIHTPLGEDFYALINDDNTKPDYDKRYISIDYAAQLKPGDVFECVDDETHWMVYLQDLVEIAYFKAEIIRCRYQIKIDNIDNPEFNHNIHFEVDDEIESLALALEDMRLYLKRWTYSRIF